MAFARWDPVRDLLAIQQRLDRFAPGTNGWRPPVDLRETPAAYVITAELPGLTREDLHIEVHDCEVTLSGVRRERALPSEHYHRIERGHGTFSRTFTLLQAVDASRVTAELRDGVLTVVCPKDLAPPVRRIPVS
jgi:HSP20 family protein